MSEKANDTDATRTTTSKTVTGAINELNTNKANKDGTNLYKGYLNINADLNTIITTGFYHMADASSITNKPSITGSAILEVLNTGTYIRQILSTAVENNIYTRTRTETLWMAWKLLVTTETSTLTLLNGWTNQIGDTRISKVGNVVTINAILTKPTKTTTNRSRIIKSTIIRNTNHNCSNAIQFINKYKTGRMMLNVIQFIKKLNHKQLF